MPTRPETEWQTIGGDYPPTTNRTAAYYQTGLTYSSEEMARAQTAIEEARSSLEAMGEECRVQDEPAPTEAQSQSRSIWDSPGPMLSNTPTRNCNPREEDSDTTIDPTFNNKMDEMLLASHVDVKDLWRKK